LTCKNVDVLDQVLVLQVLVLQLLVLQVLALRVPLAFVTREKVF
jgi:hypothetical protein